MLKSHNLLSPNLRHVIDLNTCKYCIRISHAWTIKNLQNMTYNVMMHCTSHSNNLICCLGYSCCNIKYVGQTKNRTINKFKSDLFDIKHQSNTIVARHFASHQDTADPRMTIPIREYIRTLKDAPMLSPLTHKRELVWIHRPNTIIPNGELMQRIREELELKHMAPCSPCQYYPILGSIWVS